MQLSRTWERGDTQAVSVVASQLPSLLDTMASESSCVAGECKVIPSLKVVLLP